MLSFPRGSCIGPWIDAITSERILDGYWYFPDVVGWVMFFALPHSKNHKQV